MNIKKYTILPLILILFLSFTLIGDCSWLTGYDQRIKLTIDNTKIDSALSDFPTTIFFTSTQAEEIFTEFDADSDYMKCAFTSSNGITQLYAEKELFDDSASKAIYHVKVPSVSSSADTDIYYYYDNDHADNTTYIGAINTTAGGNVWDSSYSAVYHMTDATTSTIKDSTSNSNDGTKKGANEPVEATGKVGQGQDFDGTDDYIDVTKLGTLGSSISTTEMTIFEGIIKTSETDAVVNVMGTTNTGTATNIQIQLNIDKNEGVAAGYIRVFLRDEDANHCDGAVQSNTGISDGGYHYLAVTVDGGNNSIKVYVDGVLQTFIYHRQTTPDNMADFEFPLYLGAANNRGTVARVIDGIIDEARINTTDRSAAWIKATYNSLWDTLLTYSSEETSANAIFFGMNF